MKKAIACCVAAAALLCLSSGTSTVRVSVHREHPFRSIVNSHFGIVNTQNGIVNSRFGIVNT